LRPDLRPELLPVFLLNCIMGDQMSRLLFPIVEAPTIDELRAGAAGAGPVPARRATLKTPAHIFLPFVLY
jgi:hypothetical protein